MNHFNIWLFSFYTIGIETILITIISLCYLIIQETLTRPTYWFGDRLLTNKGWGICTGIRQISTGDWLYYIQLDKPPHLQSPTQIFIDIEILKHYTGTAS